MTRYTNGSPPHGSRAWATCPMTQNVVLRIVGHARYPNSAGSPGALAQLMAGLCGLSGHVFWPDDISLLDVERSTLLVRKMCRLCAL
jgi:hypothetical protein